MWELRKGNFYVMVELRSTTAHRILEEVVITVSATKICAVIYNILLSLSLIR